MKVELCSDLPMVKKRRNIIEIPSRMFFVIIYTICAYININNRKLELTAFELFSLVNVSSFNSIHPSDRTPTLIEKSCQLTDTKDKFKDKREIPQCSKNEQITNSYIIQEKICNTCYIIPLQN